MNSQDAHERRIRMRAQAEKDMDEQRLREWEAAASGACVWCDGGYLRETGVMCRACHGTGEALASPLDECDHLWDHRQDEPGIEVCRYCAATSPVKTVKPWRDGP